MKSPYKSHFHIKILHDYFDIDCQAVGQNKEGVTQYKMKKINRSQS